MTGTIFGWGWAGILARVDNSTARPNEWCTLEVFAKDNRISVKVNGQTATESIEPTSGFVSGHIALQQFKPHTVVEFRKIEIRELDATPQQPDADNRNLGASLRDPTGTWKCSATFKNRPSDFGLKINLVGGELTGAKLGPGDQEIPVEDASYRDGELSFKITQQKSNGQLTLTYKGTVIGDTINGTYEATFNGQTLTYVWEGKREEAAEDRAAGQLNSDGAADADVKLANGMEASDDTDDDSDSETEAAEDNDAASENQSDPKLGTQRRSRGRAKPVDLLKQLNLKQPGTVGEWRMERGRLVFPQVESASLAIFDRPPEEYVLTAVVQCPSHAAYMGLGIVVGNAQSLVSVDGYEKQGSGMALIGGLKYRENGTYMAGTFLKDGKPNLVECTVRKNRVQLTCNGQTLFDWTGDPNTLSLPPAYTDGRHAAHQLFICQGKPSPFVVTKLTLTPLGAAVEKPSPIKAHAKKAKPAADKSDGWVPLFNGKDLTGWYEPEQNKGTWQVVDGALVGRGAGAGGQPAWLATKRRDFTDFQLRLELLRPPVRGQVILRAPAEGGHPYGWDGYRVALINGTRPTGQVIGTGAIGRAAGWPVGNYTAPAEGAPLPTATYTVEIHMSGKTITSFVGGTKVAQYEDPEMLYAAGQIRIYCGFDNDIIFRRIEIKEDRP